MLGELVQTTNGKWITHPPSRCPNGHPLGPGQVLVGHQACLGHGGGHTTWTCRTCDQTVYGPPLNTQLLALNQPHRQLSGETSVPTEAELVEEWNNFADRERPFRIGASLGALRVARLHEMYRDSWAYADFEPLAKYDYPPDHEEKAIELVLQQAELYANYSEAVL